MISHFHKAIFVHIPKCAGQSVEEAFCRDIDITWDKRAVLLLRPKGIADPKKAPKRLAHLKARDYVGLKYIPQDMYMNYLKFSIIRNPWDRIFSLYKYIGRKSGTFKDFVCNKLGDIDDTRPLSFYWHPQHEFLSSKKGEIIVDSVIKFENMRETIEDIFTKLGFSETSLPHKNKSKDIKVPGRDNAGETDYKDFYCEETRAIIQRIYTKDIKQFGYEFE